MPRAPKTSGRPPVRHNKKLIALRVSEEEAAKIDREIERRRAAVDTLDALSSQAKESAKAAITQSDILREFINTLP